MVRIAKDGDEQDALTRAHRFYIWKPGQRKAAKTRANRRERRQLREGLRRGGEQ